MAYNQAQLVLLSDSGLFVRSALISLVGTGVGSGGASCYLKGSNYG